MFDKEAHFPLLCLVSDGTLKTTQVHVLAFYNNLCLIHLYYNLYLTCFSNILIFHMEPKTPPPFSKFLFWWERSLRSRFNFFPFFSNISKSQSCLRSIFLSSLVFWTRSISTQYIYYFPLGTVHVQYYVEESLSCRLRVWQSKLFASFLATHSSSLSVYVQF